MKPWKVLGLTWLPRATQFLTDTPMLLIISSVTCYLAGAITGILVYRNNAAKLKATEEKAKAALDTLKK